MIAVDTSIIVAALQSWHEDHAAARTELDKALGSGDGILLPAHVLLEAFSVLTRMPTPHRLSPYEALALLAGTFENLSSLIQLPPEESWSLLRDFVDRRIVGGAVYDAAIIECSRQAGATAILTLNQRHFQRLAPAGLEVVVPATEE